MCELKAYVANDDREELLLEAVTLIRVQGAEVVLRNLFGDERTIRGGVREISLTRNRVVLERRD